MNLAVLLLIIFLPSIILGLMMRIPPIYQITQNKSWMRSVIVLGTGLLCWWITSILLMWLAFAVFYSIDVYYFDTTFGLLAGITRNDVTQYNYATINELWLRQIVPSWFSQPCFNENPTVCQLADMVVKTGSLDDIVSLFLLFGFALVPTFLNLLLSRHFTRPRPGSVPL